MAIRRDDFPLPDVSDPLVAPFFAAAARGELRVPLCGGCGRYVWYPAPVCPRCGRDDPVWTPVSGRGRLFSWVVVHRAFLPAFEDKVPFVTALVALEEDDAVRIVSYLDADPATLRAGQPVTAEFRPLAFATVPGRSVVVPWFVPR